MDIVKNWIIAECKECGDLSCFDAGDAMICWRCSECKIKHKDEYEQTICPICDHSETIDYLIQTLRNEMFHYEFL